MPDVQEWRRRIDSSRALRKKERTRVWKKLHDAWLGRLMTSGDRGDAVNPFAQFVEVVAPQLIADEPEAIVRPYRVRPDVDPEMALEFARMLQDQATGIGRAIRLRDEVVRCVWDYFWSMGVMIFGFTPPMQPPTRRVPGESRGQVEDVDLNFAISSHAEFQDPGAPFARHVSSLRFLGDQTFGRFEQGEWFAVEYFLSLPEFKALYPAHADRVQTTHKGDPGGFAGEDYYDRDVRSPRGVVLCLDIYDRLGNLMTLADSKAGIDDVLGQQKVDIGIEGLPMQILGRQWSEHSPYPVPPMASWYGTAKDRMAFLDKVFDEATKVRSVILVKKGANQGLGDQIRNSDNQGVVEVDGDPATLIHAVKIGSISRDDVDAYQLARDETEVGAGISSFQMGVRQPGEMTATEAGALQSATNIRLESLRVPVQRFMAGAYRKLIAILYSKIDLVAGMAFPLGEGDQLRWAAIDPSRPMVGELIDYHFDVGVTSAGQLTRAELGEERKAVLELALRPEIQQMLAMEQVQFRPSPIIREMLRDLRSKELEQVLVEMPPPEQQMGPAPSEEQAPAPGEEGGLDPATEYQQLAQMLTQLPDGDPQENAILDRMAQLRALMSQAPEAALAPAAAPQ